MAVTVMTKKRGRPLVTGEVGVSIINWKNKFRSVSEAANHQQYAWSNLITQRQQTCQSWPYVLIHIDSNSIKIRLKQSLFISQLLS